jgi:hypothetical protein
VQVKRDVPNCQDQDMQKKKKKKKKRQWARCSGKHVFSNCLCLSCEGEREMFFFFLSCLRGSVREQKKANVQFIPDHDVDVLG